MIPWFKMYAAETLSDERFQGWTVDERGAWLTLLLVAWREGSIPSDQGSLARLLHVDPNTMRLLWSAIGNRFVPHEDHPGRLTSPRLEIEREDAARLIQKRTKAGAAGATSRWHKAKQENGKRMAIACDKDATTMRFDGDKDRTEQDRTTQLRTVSQEVRLAGESTNLRKFREDLSAALGLSGLIAIAKPEEAQAVAAFFEDQIVRAQPEWLLRDCLAAATKAKTTPGSLRWFKPWIEKLYTPPKQEIAP
jgi:hypothetical protein